MAGNRRRKQDNSGVHAFLYVLVVLVLLCGMGYLFYYSRSQANERQECIRELESKEAATKDVVQVTVPAEPESETISGGRKQYARGPDRNSDRNSDRD